MLLTLLTITCGIFAQIGDALVTSYESHSCACIKIPSPPGTRILFINGTERHNFTVPASTPFLPAPIPDLSVCEVNVTLKNSGAQDKVLVQVWLPLNNWNGRFVATGGSGWAAGQGEISLGPQVTKGFAAAVTDAGLSGDPFSPALWALKENGEVNLELLTNFASRSIHDMAIIGKAVTSSFYGKAPSYSYWNGCSTGGRQGLVAAQKYPKDFDGILAGAPAIYWDKYVVAEHWPQVVMKEEKVFPSQCELDAVTQGAIDACDGLDSVKDGVISDLARCKFDPSTLIGSEIQCYEKEVTISSSVASVVRKIWEGQRTKFGHPLWYGLNRGSPLSALAATTIVNGSRTGSSFFVSDAWIRYFVKAKPDFDISTVDSAELLNIFHQSERSYASLMGSANPDLSGLQRSGGKLLVWHGESDQLIFPQGTMRYRRAVEKLMGGDSKVDQFFRLFIAPGVDHCGQGSTAGAIPSDPFGALMSWVEHGKAPKELAAVSPTNFTREICRYPLVAKYRDSGDASSVENFDCVQSY
jgi:hypothetical protein